MGKIIKNGIEYSSGVPDLTNILHTELDTYTAEMDEKLADAVSAIKGYFRVTTQTAGYFKFRAMDVNEEENENYITLTDHFGGHIEIYGGLRTQDSYKSYKAVRTSWGDWNSFQPTYSQYHKMEKLYLYDGYLYLKVPGYTTITFIGILEKPEYIETLDDTTTEIPIVSLFNGKAYTSLAELGLTSAATVDDVYGALKDGETAILATSEFTNQLTMFPNFCTNDQYAILQVEKKNGNRAFIEWRQKEGNAYAIAGLNSNNQFTNWGNIVRFKKDGYADDSIIAIGDTVSSDGVIQTLANLGFTGDVMTWDTGVYRVSHVEGLTNLPTDITSTAPGFRLEHYDIKKWGGNHNPNKDTWALRHSMLYAENGNVYSRYTESGATAGVYTKDTGWQKIISEKSKSDPYSCAGYTVLTGTEDLFTLAPGHYATTKADMTYNYPITDSSSLTAHIYVLGCLNDPTNNKGYRIILYFDNKDIHPLGNI